MDFDKFDQPVSKDTLAEIAKASKMSLDQAEYVAKLQKDLEAAQEEQRRLDREVIPNLLSSVDMKRIELKSGFVVTVTEKLRANIRKGEERQAFDSMVDTELQDKDCSSRLAKKIVESLWKTKYVIEDLTDEQQEQLIALGIPFQPTRTIHWQTLDGWVKRSLGKGLKVDKDNIGYFQYSEAKIKAKK